MTDPELSILLSKYTPHELSTIVKAYEKTRAQRKQYNREYMRRYRKRKQQEKEANDE